MALTIKQRRELSKLTDRPVDNAVGLIAAIVGLAIILLAIWENT